jgi:hypothetical protein
MHPGVLLYRWHGETRHRQGPEVVHEPHGPELRTGLEVQHHRTEVPVPYRPQSAIEYAQVLTELTERLDSGRIDDRDLPVLTPAVTALLDAMTRRVR